MERNEITNKANEILKHLRDLGAKTGALEAQYYNFVITRPTMKNLRDFALEATQVEARFYTKRENGAHHIDEARQMARKWEIK